MGHFWKMSQFLVHQMLQFYDFEGLMVLVHYLQQQQQQLKHQRKMLGLEL